MSNDNLPLRAAMDAAFPITDNPHGSVQAANQANRMAFAFGWKARAAQRAAVAAGVPDWFVPAPIEPTEEMYLAACRAYVKWRTLCDSQAGSAFGYSQPDFTHRDVYRAMLAAAPTPDRAPHASTAGEELSAGQERDAAPRFFMDHGLWHDRETGRHMYTQDQYDEESRACLKEGRENGQEEAAVEAMKHAGGSTAAHAIRALRSTPAGAAVTGADHARLERVIACAEILNKRPRPMCRDCADEDGTCPNSGLDCDMRNLLADARDILAKSKGGA